MLRKNRHSVYDLEYHLVVVTKYRHKVLIPKIAERLEELSKELIENNWNCVLNEINVANEHAHLLIEVPPQIQLSKLINNYKTVTSRILRKEFTEYLKRFYWKPYFWSLSYFIGSVSDRSHGVVEQYIKNQDK